MKNTINMQMRREILKEVNEYIDEFDVKAVVDGFGIKYETEDCIRDLIHQQILDRLQMTIVNAVMKTQPLMDAFTDNEIRGIMIDFKKFLNDNAKK